MNVSYRRETTEQRGGEEDRRAPMAFHASAISLREVMDKMNGFPDPLPAGAPRTILVRALPVEHAPEVHRAIKAMAKAHELLVILSLSALPPRPYGEPSRQRWQSRFDTRL